MKNYLYKIWSKFLKFFGDIKVFKYPCWLVYDPDDFQITGENILEILKILKPGDIVLRGYNRYLDGKFIPNKSGVSIKNPRKKIGIGFSHGGIYIGNNKIIHAIAEGVQQINVIDFAYCDRIAIFRAKTGKTKAIQIAKKLFKQKTPYDFSFSCENNAVYCFELCNLCYKQLQLKPFEIKKFFGFLKKKVIIAQSFIDSEKLDLIYCKNPKSKII